ncbi:MAG TPA: flavin reductase family protein [Acidimicrobiales bacterium]|nr:flavin reductase family protein [Acidimicrobiales bacterium]
MSPPRAVVGPVPPGRDAPSYDRLRRRILWSMPSGLYVLGTRAGERRNLMTVSWVTQVATEPKLVAVAVERAAHSHGLLVEGGVFAVSLLPRSQRALVRLFAKPVLDAAVDEDGVGTMHGEGVRAVATGAPVLDAASAYLDCEVRHTLELGSHTLFVGEVVACDVIEHPAAQGDTGAQGPLRMEDTRMNYGG